MNDLCLFKLFSIVIHKYVELSYFHWLKSIYISAKITFFQFSFCHLIHPLKYIFSTIFFSICCLMVKMILTHTSRGKTFYQNIISPINKFLLFWGKNSWENRRTLSEPWALGFGVLCSAFSFCSGIKSFTINIADSFLPAMDRKVNVFLIPN